MIFWFSSVLTSDLQMHGAVHGQRQGQEVEGVEAGADVTAGFTLHLGLELTVEQIHNDGAVPAKVVLPGLQKGEVLEQKHKRTAAQCSILNREYEMLYLGDKQLERNKAVSFL